MRITTLNWGLIDYKLAWDKQLALQQDIISIKRNNATNGKQDPTPNYLIFCEHPSTYTIGKNGKLTNLLLNTEQLAKSHRAFYEVDRGGDITYHNPGQLVVYFVWDLENCFTDLHKFLRYLEEAVIQLLTHYNISSSRYEGYTGVWLNAHSNQAKKICAMGLRCSRWVTMHGIALNVNNDLSGFADIIPCGIENKAVTSLEKEGVTVDIIAVQNKFSEIIQQLF